MGCCRDPANGLAGELWATVITCNRQGMGLGFYRVVSSSLKQEIVDSSGQGYITRSEGLAAKQVVGFVRRRRCRAL